MALALILLPLSLLILWAYGIAAPLIAVGTCLVFFLWRRYVR